MHLSKQESIFLATLITSIYFLSAWLQSNLLYGWDVSWGLHIANCILNGGIYGKDYFELNPPMFFYLYLLPAIATKLFTISNMIALSIYVYSLTFFSLCLCLYLAKNLFLKKDTIAYCLFMITIAAVFLLLPITSLDFGQREHLFIILMMPYILLMGCRLNQETINPSIALTVGLLAGLGFAIKPYFVITFLLLELHSIFHKRQLLAWFRIESLAIVAVLAIYMLSILLFYHSYFNQVIPLIRRYYYQGYALPLRGVVLHPQSIFCLVIGLISLIQYTRKTYFSLRSVLLISLLGSLIVYYMQMTAWSYQFYPAYSMAILLSVFYFCLFISKERSKLATLILAPLFAILIIFFPCVYVCHDYKLALDYKKKITPLIAFMHKYALGQPIYFLSTATHEEFPAVDYAGAIPASRYAMLFWIPGMTKQLELPMTHGLQAQFRHDAIYFVDSIADELNANKPILVFVQKSNYFLVKPIDFVHTFLVNDKFKAAWKAYAYLTTIDLLDVYARKSNRDV